MKNKSILAVMVAGLLISQAPGLSLAGESGSTAGARTDMRRTPAHSMASDGDSSMQQSVEVRLTEYRIEMPLELHSGPTLFKVTNVGGMFHRFEIEGNGIEKQVESGLDAGQTKTLTVDLKPGAYEVYCPVHGHKKAGMSLRVNVS